MKTLLTLLLVVTGLQSIAQEITGHLLDERKEPIINGFVTVFRDSILKGQTVTDYDGLYVIKPLEPGIYMVRFTFPGYDTINVTNNMVSSATPTTVNANMVKIIYKNPPASRGGYRFPPTGRREGYQPPPLKKEDINSIPAIAIDTTDSGTPGRHQSFRGCGCGAGTRSEKTYYLIDGVVVNYYCVPVLPPGKLLQCSRPVAYEKFCDDYPNPEYRPITAELDVIVAGGAPSTPGRSATRDQLIRGYANAAR